MHILLYVPDNHVTRNFVPQLWPFILKERTPAGHRVTIIDGNAVRLTAADLVRVVRDEQVDMVGLGFMTRMARTAYQVAAAIRAETGVPVVMGGPHVTALPDEPLGRTGLPRVADAVVIGEADEIWAEVVADASRGALADIYGPDWHGVKPTLGEYRAVDWESVDLGLFDLMRFVPDPLRRLFTRMRIPYEKAYVIPLESGRGCPYGCEFCTVTGFFGRQLRFRSNESVIAELLVLKRVAKRDHALVTVFFVDDNFAINRGRLKSLLRDMIRHDACMPWTGQISVNLLDDEELVDLIHRSGGRFIFMGLESVDPDSLKSAHKAFNKPADYARTLERMARHDVYAITSFIVGLDGDRPGTAKRLEAEIAQWPPVLPVFGLLTPYPATPLYDKLHAAGRLLRPTHWLETGSFRATFVPEGFTTALFEAEVRRAWARCYRPSAFARTQKWLVARGKGLERQVAFLIARLLFRGIYFPQASGWSWVRLLGANLPTITRLVAGQLLRRRPRPVPAPEVTVAPLAVAPASRLSVESDSAAA
jgi:radical SAM superfamily enzyme YgiQ (UPF0313 family)